MTPTPPHRAELILIRHAPAAVAGRLFGRTDVAAHVSPTGIAALRPSLRQVVQAVSSPARRCRQTCAALFDDHIVDARLWEQDFGEHDGLPFEVLPDIGAKSSADLSHYAAPGGESFADLCKRTAPALIDYGRQAFGSGPIALVVHAGVIRAALAQVTDHVPGGLTFEVGHLSITRLRCGTDGPISVIEVNRT